MPTKNTAPRMLTRNVREFIEAQGLISPRDSVLAGVSGGADSVALLHVLFDLHKSMGFRLEAAHLNHGIRGKTAEEDALFVERMCKQLGVRLCVGRVDTPSVAKRDKLSLEEAARELRLGFLRERAQADNHDKIALGHTLSDQAETVLMHIIRGAGILGVSGMKPISEVGPGVAGIQLGSTGIVPRSRVFFIRPLLATNRDAIKDFLASRKIPYREDASNTDVTFMRNRVRQELMSILREKYNPRVVEALGSHASLAAEVEDYLGKVASEAYRLCVRGERDGNIELELTSFLSYHPCIRGYLLREAFRRLCGSLKDLSFAHVTSVANLAASGQSGDSVDVVSGVSAWLDGESLWIGRTSALRSEKSDRPTFLVRLEPGEQVRLASVGLVISSEVLGRDAEALKREGSEPGKKRPPKKGPGRGGKSKPERDKPRDDDFLKSELDRAFFDLERLKPPFVVRSLELGDRIVPFGMAGTKKIQDLLVDLKVPRAKRKRLVAFCDRDQILWLVGVRRSAAAPVTQRTRSILSVRVVESSDWPGLE